MTKLFKLSVGALLALTALVGISSPAFAVEEPAAPSSPVIDGAEMFSPAEEVELINSISANLSEHNVAFAVETVASLEGREIEAVSLEKANALGVGSAADDNGVFVLLSRDDREVRFELGQGVASIVSNADTKRIIDDIVVPEFKSDNYVGGLISGMDTTAGLYSGSFAFPEPAATVPTDWNLIANIFWIFLGLIALFIVIYIIVSVRQRATMLRNIREAEEKRKEKEAIDAAEREYADSVITKLNVRAFLSAPSSAKRNKLLAETAEEIEPRSPLVRKESVWRLITNDFTEDFGVAEDESINQAAEAYKEREYTRKRNEAIAVRERALAKEAAKQAWKSLSKKEQEEFKKKQGASQRQSLIPNEFSHRGNTYDNSILYPLIMGMYFSNVASSSPSSIADVASYSSGSSYSGSNYSSGSGSSYSGSGHSSSYDSSSSSFSSFGGGGFDGGGGSGSW